jgi:hypothetical protein
MYVYLHPTTRHGTARTYQTPELETAIRGAVLDRGLLAALPALRRAGAGAMNAWYVVVSFVVGCVLEGTCA